jgi:hypothetical protein
VAEDRANITYIILGAILGAIVVFIIMKLLQRQTSSTISLVRDKEGRLIEYTILPLGGQIG